MMTIYFTVSPDEAPGAAHAADPPPLTRQPVRYWNDVLVEVFRRVGGPPGPLTRTAAMMHGAIFDVVNNQVCLDRRLDSLPFRSYLGVLPAQPGASVTDAINVAAHDVLVALHPACADLVDAALAACYPGGPPAGGSPLGRAAARAMLHARADDHASLADAPLLSAAGAGGTGSGDPPPGAWRPVIDLAPATPGWGRVTPFSFGSPSTFRPPPPARVSHYADLLGSFVYAQQVNEVKALGAADSAVRSPDQTEAAWFWSHDVDGTAKAPGHLLRLAGRLVPEGSLVADARLFALLAFALADAAIAVWDSKFEAPVSLWRPTTAVRSADADGNSCTEAAPRWRPLCADLSGAWFDPPSPSYVSSHAALAAAWAAVLREHFGTDRRSFTADTEDPHLAVGTRRTYASFSEAALECARSRVYLGVHFELDIEAGLELGGAVGRHVVRTQFYRR